MATTTTNLGLTKPDYTDAADIAVINTNMDTVDTAITATKSDLGIVEDGNTATHSITAGQYVIWKGNLYTASSAISTGTTLSTSNLTAVSNGGLNSLNEQIGELSAQIDNLGDSVVLTDGIASGNKSISNLNQYRYLNLILQNATTRASIASAMCSVPIFKTFDSDVVAFGIDTNHPGSTTRVYIYINYVNDTTINVQFNSQLGYKYNLIGIK